MAKPFLATILSLVAAMTFPSPEARSAESWDRQSALQAVARVDSSETVRQLFNLTVSGNDSELFALLERTDRRDDWPAPVRDATLFRYTLSLRQLPVDAVPPEVLTLLRAREPATLVPHEDHPQGQVPLFNVRAAAAGVMHHWTRQAAVLEGQALLRANPRSLADVFALETAAPVRSGYLQALDQATPAQRAGVRREALARLDDAPVLTPLAARAAAHANDPSAMARVLDHGEGPALQWMLQHATDALPKTGRLALMEEALLSPNREGAGLAIATLYPSLAGVQAADAALLARLGDAVLGASAALALAASPAPDTRLALDAIAAGPDRPAARRARLALALLDEANAEDLP